jgi:hypothetical protein
MKPAPDDAERCGGNAIKVYQNCIYQFRDKRNVLTEPVTFAYGTLGVADHILNIAGLNSLDVL